MSHWQTVEESLEIHGGARFPGNTGLGLNNPVGVVLNTCSYFLSAAPGYHGEITMAT